MAAVGFALKHDLQFRKNFLKRFAGIEEDEEGIKKYKLNLQAAHCADLELKNEDKGILVVIEFKVVADLEEHQNPWLKGQKPDDENLPFWKVTGKGKGYGYQFRQKNYDRFSSIYYITVQQNFDFQKNGGLHDDVCTKPRKTFFLKSRAWETLLEPDTNLEKDFVISLDELGIEELKDYRMKKTEIKNENLEAFFKGKNALELLSRISTKLGLRKDYARSELITFCTELSDGDLRQLGVRLKEDKMKTLGEIRKNFKDAEYGFYSENGQPFRAEVWFYGNEHAKPKLRALIEEELKNSVLIQEIPHDKSGLRIIRSSEAFLKDFEWFCRVLGIK